MTPVQIQKNDAVGFAPYLSTFTRDLAAAPGNVSYSGLGFKPRFVLIFFVKDTAGQVGVYMSNQYWVDNFTGGAGTETGNAYLGGYNGWYPSPYISMYQSQNDYVTGHVLSMDSNGFTIAWAKAGSPTGQMTCVYAAFP